MSSLRLPGRRLASAAIALVFVIGSACTPLFASRSAGVAAWFRVDPKDSLDYRHAFSRLPLGIGAPPCPWIEKDIADRDGPIYVLVPGLGGDHDEWREVLPVLASSHPAAIFMFRWVPWAERDPLVEDLSAGVSRLAQCLADGNQPIIVLAHSVGGNLSAFAAGRINVPPGAVLPRVFVLTVAAPLAGTLGRPAPSDGTSEGALVMDLGTAIPMYPSAAYGVEVVHLRTSFPADPHMKSSRRGHVPNDPAIGVPGARQITLAADLTHDGSLLFVARQIASGAWREWGETTTPAAASPRAGQGHGSFCPGRSGDASDQRE